MKQYRSAISLACILVSFLFSCKKSESSSVQQNDLTGNWRITRIAIDSNGNGIIDNNELLAATFYDSTHVYQFSSDGTGQVTSSGSNISSFSWALINDNTYLKLYFPGSITGQAIQHLDTLSAEVMTLRDTSVTPVVWNLYTKQH